MSDTEHLHAEGAASWDISEEVLAFIDAHVTEGAHTLETGAGQSTLAFMAKGAWHHAVTPVGSEVAAIRGEAKRRGIDDSNTEFHVGYSQDVLPALKLERKLDFVLIDGGHGFPIPAIDWTYTARHLAVGGMMMVDDVDLWSGQMLDRMMRSESAWKHVDTLRGRTVAFELVKPFELREWTNQPYVVAQSRWTQRMRKARNLAGLVARADVSAIRAKIGNERRLAVAAKADY